MTTINQERLSRRNFLKLAGLTALGVGLAACSPNGEEEEVSAVSPTPTQQSPGATQVATVPPAETAHVQGTPSFLETKKPTATPDISTYQANFDAFIKNNTDLTAAQIQQYADRLDQIRTNPKELAAYNAAAAQLIADSTVLSVGSLIPAPEALTTDPINPVFAIWEFNVNLNKWVNFVPNYQLDYPTQPGLRVMMQPPIDDPLHHWSDWPRGDRAFVVPPPKGTNAGAGEFDYDTFSFITENAAKIPAPHQLLIPVLYKNGQIVAKQQAVQVYEGGIPLTEQVERNGTTITRYVYRREWTATQDVSTTNETVELTPQQIALYEYLTQLNTREMYTSASPIEVLGYNGNTVSYKINSQENLIYSTGTYEIGAELNTTATQTDGSFIDLPRDYFAPQSLRIVAQTDTENERYTDQNGQPLAHGVSVYDVNDAENPQKKLLLAELPKQLEILIHFVDDIGFPTRDLPAHAFSFYYDNPTSDSSAIRPILDANQLHVFVSLPKGVFTEKQFDATQLSDFYGERVDVSGWSSPAFQLTKALHAAIQALTVDNSTTGTLTEESFEPNGVDLVNDTNPTLLANVLHGDDKYSSYQVDNNPLRIVVTKIS